MKIRETDLKDLFKATEKENESQQTTCISPGRPFRLCSFKSNKSFEGSENFELIEAPDKKIDNKW